MLDQLRAVYKQYGMFRSSLLRLHDDVPAARTHAKHFGSWDHAFQNLYGDQRDRARQMVYEQICRQVPEVLAYSDFFVLDRKLALSIQPAVPVPSGYAAYWPIRPDSRRVIDITLGVLLSDPDELDILGYVALPRGLAGTDTWRVCSSSTRTELFGRCELAFLQNLL